MTPAGPRRTPDPQTVRDLLRQHGLRITRQREVLYAALAGTDTHPSADELFDAVRQEAPGISLATIYNTLDAFAAAGLCRVLPGPSAARFDADMSDHVHVHTPEGRVLDLPAELGRRLLAGVDPRVLREVEAALGMPISSVRLELHTLPAAST